jgi:hypothetical protein
MTFAGDSYAKNSKRPTEGVGVNHVVCLIRWSYTTVMAASRVKTLRLYKDIMREGQKFADYNFK